MNSELYEATIAGWRIILALILPLLGCVALASLLVTVLQTVTGTREPTIPLIARLLAFVIGLYIFAPSGASGLMQLMTKVLAR